MHKEALGLKKLRRNSTDRLPKYECENCKCKRYSPCGCERKAAVPVEVPDAPVEGTIVPTEGTNG